MRRQKKIFGTHGISSFIDTPSSDMFFRENRQKRIFLDHPILDRTTLSNKQ